MTRLFALIVATITVFAVGFVLHIVDADAHKMACYPHEEVKAQLGRFGEQVGGHGVTPSGQHMVAFYSSDDSDQWTVVIFYDNGLACVVIHGKAWHVEPKGEPL